VFYYLSIALTGSIVLGVEVLSSRILTPYFGVSLYIWASILTITLICLAGGYYYGGMLTRKKIVGEIRASFYLFLNVASLALSLSAALYPFIFPALMKLHLVVGSLVAAIVLMSIPLLMFSALNSFVIVLVRTAKSEGGDAGAGTVFFVSTLGSVVGVVVTAFLIIPLLSNSVGLLVFALITALLSFAGAALYLQDPRAKRHACTFAVFAAACSIGLLVKETSFPTVKFTDKNGVVWNLIEERHSMFGSVKVVDVGGNTDSYRLYLNDGIFQGAVLKDGRSSVMFTYVLSYLLKQYAPDAKNILFLGLAAGIVPKDFSPARYKTEIVEINPDSVDVAKGYFGFEDKGRIVHIQDARTFVNSCKGSFDAIVIDMFRGDGVPDYLLTKEFFQQVKQCGSQNSVIVMNTFDERHDASVRNVILATVNTAFSNMEYFLDTSSSEDFRNGFIVASNQNLAATPVDGIAPSFLVPGIKAALSSRQVVLPSFYDFAVPLSDDHNIFSVLSSGMSMRYRKLLQTVMPDGLFKS
jgi:spermidine synthase